MYRFRLVLNDGAAGAGIRAGTAVQASTGIDDELVIALRDGTSGASVRASTVHLLLSVRRSGARLTLTIFDLLSDASIPQERQMSIPKSLTFPDLCVNNL